jgi:hypothetical protein
MTLYGTGVRRAELTHLRVSDIDSQRMVVHVKGGKGRRDRDVMLKLRYPASGPGDLFPDSRLLLKQDQKALARCLGPLIPGVKQCLIAILVEPDSRKPEDTVAFGVFLAELQPTVYGVAREELIDAAVRNKRVRKVKTDVVVYRKSAVIPGNEIVDCVLHGSN